jgi:uncharacterized protein with HEPN domain
MSEKDKGNLLAIIDASEKILKFAEDILDADAFFQDEKTFDAVLMNFVVIGESVNRLSDELITSNPRVNWRQIKGFRNIIAHDYFGVDAEEVWQIIQNYIPELVEDINQIITGN